MQKRAVYYPAEKMVYVYQEPDSPFSADVLDREDAKAILKQYGWQPVDCEWEVRYNGTEGYDHVKWVDNSPPFVMPTIDRRW